MPSQQPSSILQVRNTHFSPVDPLALPQQREHLTHEIRRANVICLVYSDAYTSSRISLFWLPFFRSMGVNLPVVLVANKSDLVSEKEAKRVLSEEMVPVMQEFKEVESCVRCSAKARFNVNEVHPPKAMGLMIGILSMSKSGDASNCTPLFSVDINLDPSIRFQGTESQASCCSGAPADIFPLRQRSRFPPLALRNPFAPTEMFQQTPFRRRPNRIKTSNLN